MWLFGGGFVYYNGPTPSNVHFGASYIIPWLCVLILGLLFFGAISPPPRGSF
jgi:hypothetical protein